MRLLIILPLLLTLVACTDNPASVRIDEGTITIYGYTFPLGAIVIEGYENIPTPTPDPAATAEPIGMPPPTTPAPMISQPTSTPRPTPTPTSAPTPTPALSAEEDLAIAWFQALGYDYEYRIAEFEEAGLADVAASFLQKVGMVVAKFETDGFSDYGAAYCRVMDSGYWPEGWALTLPPEHRAQTPAEAEIERAETWYRLTELQKATPPPELRPLHEVALSSLRGWLDGSGESFSEMWAAERDFWDTHGLFDLLGTRYDPCGWPGVQERIRQ